MAKGIVSIGPDGARLDVASGLQTEIRNAVTEVALGVANNTNSRRIDIKRLIEAAPPQKRPRSRQAIAT